MRITVIAAALIALLTACGSGGEQQPASLTERVLNSPRDYIDTQVILSGTISEIVGLDAFLLEPAAAGDAQQSGGDGASADTTNGDGLLIVRADALPQLRALLPLDEVRVFEGDTVQVAGSLVVFNIDRFEAALGEDLNDDLLARYQGEPAVLAVVVSRATADENQGGAGQ